MQERQGTTGGEPRRKFGALFAGFALLLLGYASVVPPFRAPDEVNHFFRAYEISEGHLLARSGEKGMVGDWIPVSLMKCAELIASYPHTPPNNVPAAGLAAARTLALDPSGKVFAHFPNAALYSPIGYLPAATSIAIGRVAHARPLTLLYCGRVADALVAALLLAFAIARVPRAATGLFAVVALLPMGLFQMSMVNHDVFTFGLPLVWMAEWLRVRRSGAPLPRGGAVLFVVSALFLSQTRPPYPMIALLGLALPRANFWRGKAALFFGTGLVALTFLGSLLWAMQVFRLCGTMRADAVTDPAAQLFFVAGHPAAYLKTAVHDLWRHGADYAHQLVGVFGWVSLPLPVWMVAGCALLLLLAIGSTATEVFRLSGGLRVGLFSLALAGLLLTQLLTYLIWCPIGADRIEGFQGRYLIPFLLVAALAFARDPGGLAKLRGLTPALVASAILLNLGALAVVLGW